MIKILTLFGNNLKFGGHISNDDDDDDGCGGGDDYDDEDDDDYSSSGGGCCPSVSGRFTMCNLMTNR